MGLGTAGADMASVDLIVSSQENTGRPNIDILQLSKPCEVRAKCSGGMLWSVKRTLVCLIGPRRVDICTNGCAGADC